MGEAARKTQRPGNPTTWEPVPQEQNRQIDPETTEKLQQAARAAVEVKEKTRRLSAPDATAMVKRIQEEQRQRQQQRETPPTQPSQPSLTDSLCRHISHFFGCETRQPVASAR